MKRNKCLIGVDDYIRNPRLGDLLDLRGRFTVEHYRPRKSGTLKLLERYLIKNGITNVGKDYVLNVAFNSATQIANTSWYIGLIDNAGFTALAAADTMASHAGWTEWTSYSETTRQAWGSVTSTAQSTGNATPASFTINANGTLYGMFITSNNTKGGTTGTLWSTGGFSSTVPVSTSDVFRATYNLSC
jgi:hypothetical protein